VTRILTAKHTTTPILMEYGAKHQVVVLKQLLLLSLLVKKLISGSRNHPQIFA